MAGESSGGQPPPHGGSSGRGRIEEEDARRIGIIGAIALGIAVLVIFIVENSRQVRVSFVFFDTQMSLIWVIVLSAIAGWVVGFFVARLIRRRLFPPKP